ncbi:MAG: hypothetical protein Q8N10_05680 [Phenylobacterium sp.]|uniref:hypothetical protein n=1 Tax=Phenylobacterium sp. TaxID=1871053 RepID=UPI00271BD5BC|nr:hypothetical protein [Phenylobacterium sp.]MDO8910993.1 hypothetical protein [Phenylobacterium sp.]MDO9246065.1 hypothetical protein [Phenylobacterium sp.]MDP2009923.1 hypothetical protein [Phenylobacterium sp.]MDP3099977.1 hypothetical protein [Phenylobacterium sp.]MDP3632220.1 hypothetical protein [Phenylobacterium sp.]
MGKIQGEGDYDAARRFRQAEEDFVKTGPVEQKAKEAEEALDGPEGAELEKARVDTAKGAKLR